MSTRSHSSSHRCPSRTLSPASVGTAVTAGVYACTLTAMRRSAAAILVLLFMVEFVLFAIIPIIPLYADQLDLSKVQAGALLVGLGTCGDGQRDPSRRAGRSRRRPPGDDRGRVSADHLGCAASGGGFIRDGDGGAHAVRRRIRVRLDGGALVAVRPEHREGACGHASGSRWPSPAWAIWPGRCWWDMWRSAPRSKQPSSATRCLPPWSPCGYASFPRAFPHAVETVSLRRTVGVMTRSRVITGAVLMMLVVGFVDGVVNLLAPLELAADGFSSGPIGLVFSVAAAIFIVVSAGVSRGGWASSSRAAGWACLAQAVDAGAGDVLAGIRSGGADGARARACQRGGVHRCAADRGDRRPPVRPRHRHHLGGHDDVVGSGQRARIAGGRADRRHPR